MPIKNTTFNFSFTYLLFEVLLGLICEASLCTSPNFDVGVEVDEMNGSFIDCGLKLFFSIESSMFRHPMHLQLLEHAIFA